MATGPQCPKTVLLSDGSLEFRVRRRDGSEQTIAIDLLILKLTCQECEDEHNLKAVDGHINPTPEFLQDLASRLESFGVTACTPSLAWQLWLASIEQMEQLKKTPSETPTSPIGMESIPASSPEPSELDSSPTYHEFKPKTQSTEEATIQPITVVSSGYT